MNRFWFRWPASCVLLSLSLLFPGCASDPGGPPRELGEVTGTLTLDNKPLDNVTVIFTPKEGGGPSYGLTDQEGKFELKYTSGKLNGALVGMHTVSLRDDGEEMVDGEVMPGGEVRVPTQFMPENSTLQKEVKPGSQVIDLNIES